MKKAIEQSLPSYFKIQAFIILYFAFLITLPAQSCLSDGITFSRQGQIDSFQINYPGCTQISGDILIDDRPNYNIQNLNGLSQVTSIGGNLTVRSNYNLANLDGISNVTSIGGNVNIDNNGLTSLSGLIGVSIIGGYLIIDGNPFLDNLDGLDSVKFIGSDLWLVETALSNINGLKRLKTIGGNLLINNNNALTGLYGLDSLNSIGSSLGIWNNEVLSSLQGLEKLQEIGGGSVDVSFNPLLTNLSGLDNITYISESLTIVGNESLNSFNGLGNLKSIGEDFSVSTNNVLPDFNGLDSLHTVENSFSVNSNDLISNFSGLNSLKFIGEDLRIRENHALVDLKGLDSLSFVGDDLFFDDNSSLVNLNSLDSVSFIGGSLRITNNSNIESINGLNNLPKTSWVVLENNPALTNFNGLKKLKMINGGLIVRGNYSLVNLSGLDSLIHANWLTISSNESLISFEGLENLMTISGDFEVIGNNSLVSLDHLRSLTYIGDFGSGDNIEITDNPSLISLSGLKGFEHFRIDELTITNCPTLSLCGVKSICDYLASGRPATINGNAFGCNDITEIEAACSNVPAAVFSADVMEGCAPLTVQFTDQSSGIIEEWNWAFQGGTPGSSTAKNPQVTFENPGTFEVTLVVNNDILGSSTESVMITVHERLPVGVSISTQDSSICDGKTITFFADPTNGGDSPSYQWQVNGNNVGRNQNFHRVDFPEDGDVVTCILTSSENCTQANPVTSAPIVVEVFDAPAIDIEGDSTFCMNDSTILTAIGMGTFLWSTDDTTASIIVKEEDTYFVTVTDQKGCTNTTSITIDRLLLPITILIDRNPDTVCIDASSIELEGGFPAGGVYSGPGVENGFFDPSIAGVGVHTITYTYTNSVGCSDFATEEINVEVCTNIIDPENAVAVNIFPNPSRGAITIQLENWSGEAQVQIFNVQGQPIYSADKISGQLQVRDLPAGIYLLQLSTGSFKTMRKLVIY